jgi:hypothetical protein
MMEGTLKSRDGKLYVLYTYDEYSEPYRQYLWWRVLEIRGTGYGERPETGDIATSEGGGGWRTRNPATHRSTGSVSTGTGSTQAETVERVSIHPPAVGGKELRWRDGRWEKLLAKGWVPAGEGKSKEASQAAAPRKTKRQLDADIDEALAGSGSSPRLSRRTKWNLYDKAGHLVGDVSAYSAEEALRLAGGPGVASARLPRQGGR